MRQIVLDTETTGRDVQAGHRIIEIGCLELIDRRITGQYFHQYLNPERESEAGAFAVHGLSQEFLSDKPLFKNVVNNFLDFIKGAELIIHNAPFDLSFLNNEIKITETDIPEIKHYCSVIDTLPLARQMHPGQRNSLDALCKRYGVDNSHRNFHGALLDAELLAKVYLIMTGGQTSLFAAEVNKANDNKQIVVNAKPIQNKTTPVVKATLEELKDHLARLAAIKKQAKDGCLWDSIQDD